MGRRYSFIVLLAALMGLLVRAPSGVFPDSATRSSAQVGISTAAVSGEPESARGSLGGINTDRRQAVVEFLDRAIHFHRYRKTMTGSYSTTLEVDGFEIPEEIRAVYGVEIVESASDLFRLRVTSRPETQLLEQVLIDQNYRVSANFPLPPPRLDYLRLQAQRHLQALQHAPSAQFPAEEGVYAGYFRYSAERIPGRSARRVAAVGVRAPIEHARIEGDAHFGDEVALDRIVKPRLGQQSAESSPRGALLGRGWGSPGEGGESPFASARMADAVREEVEHSMRALMRLGAESGLKSRAALDRSPAAAVSDQPGSISVAPANPPNTQGNALIIEPMSD